MKKIKLLVADDHPVVREGLETMLQSTGDFEIVGQATNGEEAVELAESLQPDVVIIDIQMPKLSGIEATRQIRACVPQTQVVVLSSFDEDDYIYQSIQAGAVGFVLKDSEFAELIEVIQAAARGETLLPTHIATKLAAQISAPNSQPNLTNREYDVLKLLARGLRNKEIGDLLHISERTVKNHVNNILTKMDVRSRTEAVTQAIRENLIDFE